MSNESEINEYAAGLERVKKMRFGCIVENLYASEKNPHRFSIFIRTRKHRGRVWAECTDGEGEVWLGGIERLFMRSPSLKENMDRLQAFKDYVHKRLDDAGIPTHPDGEHSAAGCRIGDRLDIVFAQLDCFKGQLEEATACVEAACGLEGYVKGEDRTNG